MSIGPNDFTVSLLPNPLKVVLGMTGTISLSIIKEQRNATVANQSMSHSLVTIPFLSFINGRRVLRICARPFFLQSSI